MSFMPQGPFAEPRNQIPPWQIVVPVHDMGIIESPDGAKALSIQSPAPNITIIVPLSPEEAKSLGEKLIAPRIEVAGPGQMPTT